MPLITGFTQQSSTINKTGGNKTGLSSEGGGLPTGTVSTGAVFGENSSPNVGVKSGIPPALPNSGKPKVGTIGGENVSVGKPSTGLPPDVQIDDWSPQNKTWMYKTGVPMGGKEYKEWVNDVKTPPKEKKLDPTNVLPAPQIETAPPIFVDTTKKYWVWNECNQRWWTPDTAIPGGGGINQAFVQSSTSGLGGNNGIPQSFGAQNNGMIDAGAAVWATYDNFNRNWIRRTIDKWCTPEDKAGFPVQDDCAKYGINCPEKISSGKVYTKIDPEDILGGKEEFVTYSIWNDSTGSLSTFYTCSNQPVSESFVKVIFDRPCGNCGSEPMFDIAYGHDGGSGSQDLGGYDWLTPTNAVYSQYKQLCIGAEKPWFTIGGQRLQHVYVINIRQNKMKDRIDEGNIELNLAHLSGSLWEAGGFPRNAHTGSNVRLAGNSQVLRLIDDSHLDYLNDLSPDAISGSYSELGATRARMFTAAGEVYHLVSGSLELGVYNKTNPSVYGLVYPRLGVLVLDASKLDSVAGFLSVTGSDLNGQNNRKLLTSISGAAQYTDSSGDVLGFACRRTRKEYSTYYFVRVKNSDYNFTNNPSYVTGSTGDIISDFLGNPKVYFTEIGFYNEQRELLAVGKMSQPQQKSYISEALFTVKLGL